MISVSAGDLLNAQDGAACRTQKQGEDEKEKDLPPRASFPKTLTHFSRAFPPRFSYGF
jgi:hypothetical protein